MAITEAYKELKCIDKMSTEYKNRFFNLAEHYGEILNKGNQINSSVFTLHDFDHHCFNIYKIISSVILEENSAYDKSNGLTKEELYILNVAVLFHDISMAANINWDRKTHSKQSGEYIEKEYKNKSSILYTKGELGENEMGALKLIVKAHSDIKDNSVSKDEQGIKDPELTNELPSKINTIRGKLLAGILRLADELDVTNERLGNTDSEEQLSIKTENEGKQQKEKKIESLNHWKKLHYFKQIKTDKELYTQINLITNDEHIKRMIEQGDLPNIVSDIIQIENKIKKEFMDIDNNVFKTTYKAKSFILINDICIKTNISELKTELQKERNRQNISASPENLSDKDLNKSDGTEMQQDIESKTITKGIKINKPSIINEPLKKK